MDNLVDMGNLNPREEIEPVNAQRGQEGQNRQTIHGQSGNNNIVYMANDRYKAIRSSGWISFGRDATKTCFNEGSLKPLSL